MIPYAWIGIDWGSDERSVTWIAIITSNNTVGPTCRPTEPAPCFYTFTSADIPVPVFPEDLSPLPPPWTQEPWSQRFHPIGGPRHPPRAARAWRTAVQPRRERRTPAGRRRAPLKIMLRRLNRRRP